MNTSGQIDKFITADAYRAILSDRLITFSKYLNGGLEHRHVGCLDSDVLERINRLVSEAKNLGEELDPPEN